MRRAWPFGLSCVQNAPNSPEHQDTAAGPVRCGNAAIRGPGGGPFGGFPGVLFVACTQVRADFSAVARVGYHAADRVGAAIPNLKASPGAATWACAVPAFCLPPGGRFANTPRDRAGLFANRSDLSGSPGSRERKPPPSYPAVLPICTSPIPRRNAHLAVCGPGRPGTGRFCM